MDVVLSTVVGGLLNYSASVVAEISNTRTRGFSRGLNWLKRAFLRTQLWGEHLAVLLQL